MRTRSRTIVVVSLFAAALVGCGEASSGPASGGPSASASAAPNTTTASLATGAASAKPAGAPPPVEPFKPLDSPLHVTSLDELLSFIPVTAKKTSRMNPDRFLAKVVSPDGPGKFNQGNPAIAKHEISRAACIAGLRGAVLQTPEQRALCGGRENMVPIFKNGDPNSTKTCIDVFEFPNKPCELPAVWVPPTYANVLCELQGKRLCTQDEWVLACAGDPAGGKRRAFAYGDQLDLAICNTNKSARGADCDAKTAKTTWKTCPTRTEPAGAYPACKSRFGVYDLHGNVAEAMTRVDEGTRVSQLKGSAWFYVDVARKPGVEPTKENYSDECAHNPRWHVEPMRDAMHSNYHLGFRCCATVAK